MRKQLSIHGPSAVSNETRLCNRPKHWFSTVPHANWKANLMPSEGRLNLPESHPEGQTNSAPTRTLSLSSWETLINPGRKNTDLHCMESTELFVSRQLEIISPYKGISFCSCCALSCVQTSSLEWWVHCSLHIDTLRLPICALSHLFRTDCTDSSRNNIVPCHYE